MSDVLNNEDLENTPDLDEEFQDVEENREEEKEEFFVKSVPHAGAIASNYRVPKEEPLTDDENAVAFPGANEATIDGPFRELCDTLKPEDWVNVVKTKWPGVIELGAEMFAAIGGNKPLER